MRVRTAKVATKFLGTVQKVWKDLYGVSVAFDCCLYAEKQEQKQEFLVEQFDPEWLVGNAAELNADSARNLAQGGAQGLLPFVWMLDAGFPCTSRTPLSSRAAGNVNCVHGLPLPQLRAALVLDSRGARGLLRSIPEVAVGRRAISGLLHARSETLGSRGPRGHRERLPHGLRCCEKAWPRGRQLSGPITCVAAMLLAVAVTNVAVAERHSEST